MEIVQIGEGRKGKSDKWYIWDLEWMINNNWRLLWCHAMKSHNLHIDFIPDGILEYVIVERALDGSQGL